jgi:hypothetical protein
VTEPADFPAPDLKDSSGRLRRIVISLLIGGAAGGAVYALTNALAKPDESRALGVYSSYHVSKAYQFVGYFTGLAFIVVFLIAMAVQKKLADRAYVKGLSPQVRVHKQ